MNKKNIFLVVAAVLAAWGLVCGGCKSPDSVTTTGQSGYGRIQIIAQEGAVTRTARTVFPAVFFDRYTYTFIAEGKTAGVELTPDSSGFFTLETGSYTVAVSAFIGKAKPYTLAASGVSEAFSISPGDNQAVVVALSVVTEGGDISLGEFSYIITYPPDAIGEIALYAWPDMNDIQLSPSHVCEANGLTEALDLAAGTYLMTVKVKKDGRFAGLSEAIHIYPSLITFYDKEFIDEDFIEADNPPEQPPPEPPFIGNVKFEYFWVDQHDSFMTTGGSETTIAVNETLAITAQGEGYTVKQWHLNGVVTEQSGDTFYFTSVTTGNHMVGILVVKEGKLYNSNIIIKVVNSVVEPVTRTVTVDMYDSAGDGWNGGAALRINVNGITIANSVKVSSTAGLNTPAGQRNTHTYSFPVVTGDVVQLYWVAGTGQGDNSFIMYYSDTPPNPAFTTDNKGTKSWSGTNALLYRLRVYAPDGLIGVTDGTLLGEVVVQ
jgi:hypothetical protein